MNQLAPAQSPRLDTQLALFRAVQEMSGAGQIPKYFAHLRLRSGDRTSDLLLGNGRRLGGGVSMIDWQTAPLAQVFFSHEEGDDYEVEIDGRVLEGEVLEKNLLGFDLGGLAWIEWDEGILKRQPSGEWAFTPGPVRERTTLRPAADRRPFRSPLEVTLDPAQQRVVDLPSNQHTLLLGEAGFGKTTVALHRLAAIQARAGQAAQQGGTNFRGLVLVPTPGLRKLTELMLERKAVPGVEVWTWDAWAAKLAKHAFADVPERKSFCMYGAVVRAKRHRLLRTELATFVAERPEPAVVEGKRRTKALASRYDLEHLFGDRERMTRLVDASNGEIKRTAIEELAEHTRIQFSDSEGKRYRDFDVDALVTADGRGIDEGTPMENANSNDVEDYAVLFELDRLRALAQDAKPASVPQYDAIVLDEAQEFAPLELALAGRAVRRGGALIISGDAAQQIDPSTDFPGWDGVMVEMGVPDHHREVLAVNYRCPPSVTELGRAILEPRAGASVDPLIETQRFEAPAHLAMWLTEELGRISYEDRTASVAVICRSAGIARSLSRTLKHGADHALSLGGHFNFAPGVLVTAVPEVKGLEFDYVIVADADSNTYPDTPESRRTLYVAVTRATHRLVLACSGNWSTLLPPILPAIAP